MLLGANLVDLELRGEFQVCAGVISLPYVPQLSAKSLREIAISLPALYARVSCDVKSGLSGQFFLPMRELIEPWPRQSENHLSFSHS